MEEKHLLVRYVKSGSHLFCEGGIYEVIEKGDSYLVITGHAKGFYIDKRNSIRVGLSEELFEWESE